MKRENECEVENVNVWLKFWLGLFVFILFLAVVGIGINQYYHNRLISFEMEGSCNSGHIGIDYKSVIDNQPYFTLDRIYDGSNPKDFRLIERKSYFTSYLPQQLNLKDIDGLNCNFKVKGAVPLYLANSIK